MEALEALEKEAAKTGSFLRELSDDDWARPTRCPPWDVLQLAAHTLRGALRIVELLAGPVAGEPEMDGVTYFRYDPDEAGPGVVRRAQEDARTRTGTGLKQEWGSAWDAAIATARGHLEDDPVLASPFGTIRLREYLRTRCVEVTIHTMDLRDALGLDPDPTREGLVVTTDVLRDLLGADQREVGMDDVRFALAGSGRATLTQSERERLGPLADLFPLFR